MPAWRDAEALIRATARVERSDDGGSWTWRGTAFFVGEGILLTCAHVVAPGDQLRVVWHGGDERSELPVAMVSRHPDVAALPDGPYPLPDLAVLHVEEDVPEHPIVWLDTTAPGEDLWAFGYTDEYREGMAFGHSARFTNAGRENVDDEGGRVWRLKGDRIKPGMSGAPLLDLGTGRVVAVVKRTQDAYQSIGAFATGMAEIQAAIPDICKANHDVIATPERDEKMAISLWGPRVVDAAEPLRQSAVARGAVVQELGLAADELHGDAELDARRIGRALFFADLATVTRVCDPPGADRRRPQRAEGIRRRRDVHQLRGRAVGCDRCGRRARRPGGTCGQAGTDRPAPSFALASPRPAESLRRGRGDRQACCRVRRSRGCSTATSMTARPACR